MQYNCNRKILTILKIKGTSENRRPRHSDNARAEQTYFTVDTTLEGTIIWLREWHF